MGTPPNEHSTARTEVWCMECGPVPLFAPVLATTSGFTCGRAAVVEKEEIHGKVELLDLSVDTI